MFQCRPNRHFEETLIHQAAPGRAGPSVRPARFSLIICGFLSPLSLSGFPSCAPTSVALQTRGPHHCLPSPLPPACDFRFDFSGPTPAVAIPNAR
jgi:hypothetical protein